ncbi:response regulator [Desulfoluna spongiiphila]|uniref:Response regulator receiver domain-containing protein n=1 Tax=Desulfoluna spongiiphila TaxID=419481 RepID=A0A1G5IUK5_9BACT|nr:response regulator [Desulfoluna spongiiphila]SCY79752.1 Response regulator receiver domain-containing protein [Desulfoluna spongiiphila]VVS93348.1 signal transduction response regulator receiver domain [Desulfoluna spongiiphila]
MTYKPHVLVVDDEKEFANTLAKRLELRDFNTQVAYSGEEALAILTEGLTDLVILDVLMPGLDGCETLVRIKADHPLVPVLMLTGEATVERAITGMKAGALDFLMKPCDIGVIAEKLEGAYKLKCDHEARIRDAEINNIIEKKGW